MQGSFNIITFVIFVLTGALGGVGQTLVGPAAWLVFIPGGILMLSPRIVREWDRGILLRLGRFKRMLDPGLCWVIPGIDQIAATVDMRVRATSFSAERTLTSDTVPVNVDAVLFWRVMDAKKAVLEVDEFGQVISWAAQTTLRDVIGKSDLVRMISERESLDEELQGIIGAKTGEWGIKVMSVEIRDVKIPGSLEDAMSRKAQADREREARIILADSEKGVADRMEAATEIYQTNEHAMQLRAMNMTYEAIKERGALMVIPTNMTSSMDGTMGMAAAGFRVGNKGEGEA